MRRRFSAFRPAAFDHGEPISRIVLAPVAGIACIAVALLSFSLPAQTHALMFDLPVPNYVAEDFSAYEASVLIELGQDGDIQWDGQAVSIQQLRRLLNAAGAGDVKPILRFGLHGQAAYGAVIPVLDAIADSGLQYAWMCFPSGLRPDDYAARWPDQVTVEECMPFNPA